jgi:superfamily II DNA or RNA helicase
MSRVVAVRRVDALEEVFDIEMPDTHNFVAEGMVVHNCHRVPADTFSNTAFLFPAKLRLGLSATPERADGKSIILGAHIGPVRVEWAGTDLIPKILHINSAWKCPMVRRRDPDTGEYRVVQLPHSPGRIGGLMKSFAQDDVRNGLIVEATMMAYRKGRKIVMFTDTLEHVETLRMVLKHNEVPWNEIGIYVGGMKEAARDKAVVKPITITTYKMTSEGTNVPWWDTAVLCTPRSDVVQIVGRVLREYPDKQAPIVIDITDLGSSVLSGYSRSRRRWYTEIGAEQVQL